MSKKNNMEKLNSLAFEVKEATAKLKQLERDENYILHKLKMDAQKKIINRYKEGMKQVLKFKYDAHGLVVPSDSIEQEWRRKSLTLRDFHNGKTRGYTINHYFNDGEIISFDAHKQKPSKKTTTRYTNIQWEDVR